MLTLKSNRPLDLLALGALLSNKNALELVWPDAQFSFSPEQGRAALTAREGSKSYVVVFEGRTIGHGALLGTEEKEFSRFRISRSILTGAGMASAINSCRC
jgi:hypothetical protein